MSDHSRLHELTKVMAIEMTIASGEMFRAEIDPDSWQTRIYSETAYITLSMVTANNRPPRLKAWASVPKGIAGRRSDITITMSTDRTPSAIAQDIKQRLFTHAQEYLIECRTAQEEHDKQERKEQLIKNLLSKYLVKGYDHQMHTQNIRAEIRSSYIEMKIDATPTEALKICKLLKGNL